MNAAERLFAAMGFQTPEQAWPTAVVRAFAGERVPMPPPPVPVLPTGPRVMPRWRRRAA